MHFACSNMFFWAEKYFMTNKDTKNPTNSLNFVLLFYSPIHHSSKWQEFFFPKIVVSKPLKFHIEH